MCRVETIAEYNAGVAKLANGARLRTLSLVVPRFESEPLHHISEKKRYYALIAFHILVIY